MSDSVGPPSISAGDVRPGDVIRWCDRSITITAVTPAGSPRNRRPGVYLTADKVGRLHYYADERVVMADG